MEIVVQIVVQIIAEGAEYDEEDWANTCYVLIVRVLRYPVKENI